jgi:SAM-dependent methyltransferase
MSRVFRSCPEGIAVCPRDSARKNLDGDCMMMFAYGFLALAGFILVASLTWRWSSRRHTLPCPVWLRWLVELDNPFTRTNRAGVIVQHLELEPGMTVLDMGCGPGRVTLPVARRIGPRGRVVAMDIQEGMLRRAREKAHAENLRNIQFLQAGAGEGKLGQAEYDRVLLVTVLGEIPDREAAMREIHAALKPGGLLSVTEIIFDPHFQGRDTVLRLARAAGLCERSFHGNRLAYTLNLERPGG